MPEYAYKPFFFNGIELKILKSINLTCQKITPVLRIFPQSQRDYIFMQFLFKKRLKGDLRIYNKPLNGYF